MVELIGNVCNSLSLDSAGKGKIGKDKKENKVKGKILLTILEFLLN